MNIWYNRIIDITGKEEQQPYHKKLSQKYLKQIITSISTKKILCNDLEAALQYLETAMQYDRVQISDPRYTNCNSKINICKWL